MTETNNSENPITRVSEDEITDAVFAAIYQLLHSKDLDVTNFHSLINDDEAIQAQVVIGQPSSEDGHVLVSTFGLGSVELEAQGKIDEGEEIPLRVELFAVAKNPREAKLIAAELAELAFNMNESKVPLLPGTIIGKKGSAHYAFSQSPYGIHSSHGHAPVVTPSYMVTFFAANRISETEAQMLTNPETAQEFMDFYNSLGKDAYSTDRPEYVKE